MPTPGVFKTIKPVDVNVTPFKTYKQWRTTESNYSHSYGLVISKGTYPQKTSEYSEHNLPIGTYYVEENEYRNPDGTYASLMWHSVNHLYYDRVRSPFEQFGPTDLNKIDKFLYESASIVSIPQRMYNEGLKPGSIEIWDSKITSSYAIHLRDDEYGNLYDIHINTGSFIPSMYLVGYWSFNEKYTTRDRYNNTTKLAEGRARDRSDSNHHAVYINTRFEPGIKTTGLQVSSSGYMATLDGDGMLFVEEPEYVNFKKDEDFAISLWINLPDQQVNSGSEFNYLISKEGDKFQQYFNQNAGRNEEYVETYTGNKYPYAIKFYNQTTLDGGKLHVSRCDIRTCPYITSSMFITGSQHHIVFNKSGSQLQLWIDGTLDGTTIDTTTLNTDNDAILCFGSKGYQDNTGISGSLDEIRFYKKALTPAEINSLSNNDYMTGSAYNTARVGNAFYKHGMLVLSDPRPKYQGMLVGRTGLFDYSGSAEHGHGFELKFRATHTIYENEVLCRIREDEFNFTMNPTIRRYNDANSQLPKAYVTHSEWTPYVTTVGLFDDYGRLLVVGKLSTPIPKRDDVETTIIVRYDT